MSFHINDWLERKGFEHHPFGDYVAERDKNLKEETFIQFPYYTKIEQSDRPIFLFLKRGMGKSANRFILERRLEVQESIAYPVEIDICVPYTDFFNLFQKDVVKAEHHIENILIKVVSKLYYVATNTDRIESIRKLTEKDREDFISFLKKYSDCLNDSSLKGQIITVAEKQQWNKDHIKELSQLGVNVIKDVLKIPIVGDNSFIKALSLLFDVASPKDINVGLPGVSHSHILLIERLGKIAKSLKIKNVIILVDGVDEFAKPKDFPRVANILKPLVEVSKLFEIEPYSFKFFIPYEIYNDLKDSIREDRFESEFGEEWHPDQLKDLIEKRLDCNCKRDMFDSNARKNFLRLFRDEDRSLDIVNQIVNLADKSPRKLIRICKMIIDEHTSLSPIPDDISKETFDKAMNKFKQRNL